MQTPCRKYLSLTLLLAWFIIFANAQKQDVAYSISDMKAAKDSVEYSHAVLDLAASYLFVNPDSSLYYAKSTLSFAERNNNSTLKAGSLLAIGEYYSYINQQIQALEYILDALEIYTNLKNVGGIGHCNFALGELYNIMNQYILADQYFHESIENYKKSNKFNHQLASSYASLGDNFFTRQLYDSSLYYIKIAIELGKKLPENDVLEYAYGTMADILIAQKKIEEATQYLKMSKAISESTGNNYNIAYSLMQEGKILGIRKMYHPAIKLLDSSISIAAFLKMDDLIMTIEKEKYNLCKEAGMWQEALKSLEIHDNITDTLLGPKKYHVIKDIVEKFLNEKKEKEFELLQKESTINRVLIVSLIFISILTLSLYLFAKKRANERREMLSQLAEKNESIEKQAKHLQHINIVKDRMFSIISHDLRGPVASLKGLIDFMKSGSLTAEESNMIVQELKMSVSGVDMLLENLLIWAQIQIKGEVSIKNETVFIKELVNNIFYISANSAKQKNIPLIEVSDEDIVIETDKNKLALIIRNLVNNAIKFTPENGSITVSTQKLDGKVKICVTDTGIGMSEEEKNKLFNIEKPFTKRGTANEKGSGLGLMFVKEYVQSLGGEFTICSTVGKGSSFCIVI